MLMKLSPILASVIFIATPVSADVDPKKSYGPTVFPGVPQSPENVVVQDTKIVRLRLITAIGHAELKALKIWKDDWGDKGKSFDYCHYSPMSGVAGSKFWFMDIRLGITAVFSRDCGTADRSQVAVSCGGGGNNYDFLSRNYGGKAWSSWEIPGVNTLNGESDAKFVADVCFYAD